MKKIILMALIAFGMIGCAKKYPSNCNCPGNNNWSQPVDSFLHITGTINGVPLVEGTTYPKTNKTKVMFTWDVLPAPYNMVQAYVYLYDASTGDALGIPYSTTTTKNKWELEVPTGFSCNSILIQLGAVPLTQSGKKSSQYNVYLSM